jgi:hypothetical protein
MVETSILPRPPTSTFLIQLWCRYPRMLCVLLALRSAKMDIRSSNRTGTRFIVIIDNIRRKKVRSVFVTAELRTSGL